MGCKPSKEEPAIRKVAPTPKQLLDMNREREKESQQTLMSSTAPAPVHYFYGGDDRSNKPNGNKGGIKLNSRDNQQAKTDVSHFLPNLELPCEITLFQGFVMSQKSE